VTVFTRLLASRQQWPSAIFALTLLAFAAIWGLATMIPGQWCEAGESGVVCFRNWINAVGSSLALIVATAALLVSLRRPGERRRRVSAQAAPVLLGERRAVLYDIRAVAVAARQHAAALRASADELFRANAAATVAPGTLAELHDSFSELYRAWPRHDSAITAVAGQAGLAGQDARYLAGRLAGLGTEIAAALAFVSGVVGHHDRSGGIAGEQPALAHLRQVLDALQPKFELLLRDIETLVAAD